MYKYRFSLFTATYNRADQLLELSKCIDRQTYQGSFEWVIVSDGSTDHTAEVVASIKASSRIPIVFVDYRVNRGKHHAWKSALEVFQGRYVITCDDDDPISADMLQVFDHYWQELEQLPDYERYWEVRARAQYEDGRLVGPVLPQPYLDSDYNELTFQRKQGCEMVGCRKLEVLKKEATVPAHFYFEESCSNFPEGVRWSKAARIYKTRFVPDVVRTYVIGHDSLCYQRAKMPRTSRKNYNSLVNALYAINEQGDLLRRYDFVNYLKTILHLSYSSVRVKEHIVGYINRPLDRFLAIVAYCPAYLLYLAKR